MKRLLCFFAVVSAGIVAATNLISPEISVEFERSSASPIVIFSAPAKDELASAPPAVSIEGIGGETSEELSSAQATDPSSATEGALPASGPSSSSDARVCSSSGGASSSGDSSCPSSGGASAEGEGDNGAIKRYSALRSGGSCLFRFDANSSDISELLLREKLKNRVPFVGGSPDHKSFAFSDRMTPLSSPLSDEEVAYLFYEIVASCTPAVPIKGRLTELEFSREGSSLTARAVIALSFEEIKTLYRLSFLPSFATFVLFVPFEIKNSEISVHSEGIELTSNTFSLPKKLLILGCNAAFGKKDYQDLFGKAIENVFINAGIFSSSY